MPGSGWLRGLALGRLEEPRLLCQAWCFHCGRSGGLPERCSLGVWVQGLRVRGQNGLPLGVLGLRVWSLQEGLKRRISLALVKLAALAGPHSLRCPFIRQEVGGLYKRRASGTVLRVWGPRFRESVVEVTLFKAKTQRVSQRLRGTAFFGYSK